MMTVVIDVQGLLSIYIGTNTVVNNQSVLQAMQRRGAVDGFDVTYSLGCSPTCNSSAGFADAVNTAAAADVVVLVVGLYPGCVVPVLCALLSRRLLPCYVVTCPVLLWVQGRWPHS
jgi:hypothetical protein